MNEIPVIGIVKSEAQTQRPANSDPTMMDDTVMTMDGTALMGGQTIALPAMKLATEKPVPRPTIKINR